MSNAINWFEIPVTNMDRATRFYDTVLGVSLHREIFNGTPNAIFPGGEKAVRGSLVFDPKRKPTADGQLVYLNVTGKLDACLGRVTAAGGAVVLPRTHIGDPGYIAILRDTEGNLVGLHSPE